MLSGASRGALDDMELVAVSCRSRHGWRVGEGSYRGSLHVLSPVCGIRSLLMAIMSSTGDKREISHGDTAGTTCVSAIHRVTAGTGPDKSGF